MSRRPAPGSPRWRTLVTASKVAAIAGVSTYDSPLSMWHKMRGDIPWTAGTAVTQRGHDLEAAVLGWWRRQHGIRYRAVRRQVFVQRDDIPWAAATLDGLTTVVLDRQPGTVVTTDWIVEAKTSIKDDEWGEPGTDQIPVDYLTQAYWALLLCPDAAEVRVPMIGSRLEFAEYVVKRDDGIQQELLTMAEEFHRSLSDPAGRPALDDHLATRDALRRLHPDIDRGATVHLGDEVGVEFLAADVAMKAAEVRLRGAQIQVLDQMGRANYAANTSGVRFARRQPGRGGTVALHAVHPKGSKP